MNLAPSELMRSTGSPGVMQHRNQHIMRDQKLLNRALVKLMGNLGEGYSKEGSP